jgi:hypothetical protein
MTRRHGEDRPAPEAPADGHPNYGPGLCSLPHHCPNCLAGDGPCMDLFDHHICGVVSCHSGGNR